MDSELPHPRYHASAEWNGEFAYVFGGADLTTRSNEIYRFDPQHDEIEVLGVHLPTPRELVKSAWNGTVAYIFGGKNAGESYDDILTFDPHGVVHEEEPEPNAPLCLSVLLGLVILIAVIILASPKKKE
jgi:hypothetical protein